jgi:hypothetical protein
MSLLQRFFRLIVALVVTMVVCIGGAFAYLAHESRRASLMLRDLESVNIGDSEGSVVSLLQKYGGYRWVPTSGNDAAKPDWEYIVEVNRWRLDLKTGHSRKFDFLLRAAPNLVNSRVRGAVGLREWLVSGRVAFKENHVISVAGIAEVEGRNEILAGMWNLAAQVPESEQEHFVKAGVSWPHMDRYLIGFSNDLNLYGGSGEVARSWITPLASEDERRFAREFELQCLTSRSGCQTVCDLVPGAVEYARSGTWAERKNACTVPRPNGYR